MNVETVSLLVPLVLLTVFKIVKMFGVDMLLKIVVINVLILVKLLLLSVFKTVMETSIVKMLIQFFGKLMIVAACMFILGYAMTWAPGVWILIGETFPTRTRAKQGALATASNWLWNFLLAFFTPFIVKSIKYRYGFIFASCNLLGAAVVYLFLYESSDLTLESVNLMYIDPNCKPWTSRRWAPPGFSSRRAVIDQTRAEAGEKPMADREEERIEGNGVNGVGEKRNSSGSRVSGDDRSDEHLNQEGRKIGV